MKADPRGVLEGDHFLDGDHAACEGALAAGCRFTAGYPITPSTEVAEHMAWDADAALQDGEAARAQELARSCLELVPGHPRCTALAGGA